MSRDLTPKELYLFEQYNVQHGGGSLWDMMKNTTVTYNGQTGPMHSEESLAARAQYPLLGRLFNRFDSLHSFLSQVENGLEILSRHEKDLDTYIRTGQGDKDSSLIRWFEGTLDEGFHYSDRNDALFMASVQDEIGQLYRFDPKQENCFWFPLNEDKCISVWYAPDKYDGDQLLMHLEERAEDGSMGPHCEILSDESYATANLSQRAIRRTLREIYDDADLEDIAKSASQELSEKVMSVFGLKKMDLENQIASAASRSAESHGTSNVKVPEQER